MDEPRQYAGPDRAAEAAFASEAWQRILASGHWDCGGWTAGGPDGALACACGAVVPELEGAEA